MRKIVFLAHDPGGYGVVQPVYDEFLHSDFEKNFYCVGPASKINCMAARRKDEISELIFQAISKKELSCLITGTSWGDTFELEMIEKCNQAGIVTISILDYWSNYSKRFVWKNGFCYPRYYVVMDDLAKKEAIIDGVPEKILRVLGHPGLQKYSSLFDINTNNSGINKVLLLSQPLSALYGKALGYTEYDFLQACIQVLEELEKDFRIKFHPKESSEIKQLYKTHIVDGELDELVKGYDVIIGMNSMALLYAYLLGKKIISYQPNLKGLDLCITNKLGITKNLGNKQQLRNMLSVGFALDFKQDFFIKDSIRKIVNFILTKVGAVNHE